MTDQTEPVYQVKLLAALRSGDPALIHPFLTEIGKDRRSSDLSSASINTAAAALHLAVRCGSTQTVALLLSHRAISPNGVHPPGSGTTPLHLAASLGRTDIVNLLLEQDGIDDSIRDAQGRTCRDVAKGKDVTKAIDDSRSFLNASFRSLLRSYILSSPSEPPSHALIQLLESPRVAFVNLSYLDDDTGSSLLHEAARRKDLRLIELAVRAGADVFVRNRRGKTPYESAGKDDKVRVFLRQFANHDRTLIQAPTPISEPPTLKGYLNKYTNVAKGYNTRWFVLNYGVLSYYRHQDDEAIASRGSISMKNAVLKTSDRTRFEIQSLPSTSKHTTSNSSIQKWYIRANHPVEASRWIQAITKSIEWYKRDVALGAGEPELARRQSGESDARSSVHSTTGTGTGTGTGYSNAVIKKLPPPPSSLSRRSTAQGDTDSINAALSGDPNLSEGGRDGEGEGDEEHEGEDDSSSSADSGGRQVPPHDAAFELHANSAMAQLELTQQLLNAFLSTIPTTISSSGRSSTSNKSTTSSNTTTTTTINEMKTALVDSFGTLQSLLGEYQGMIKEREGWFRKQIASERARQAVWEESLAIVVREGAALEEELRVRSRRRGSRVFGAGEAFGSVLRKGGGGGGGVGGFGSGFGEGGMGSVGRRVSGRYSTVRPATTTTAAAAAHAPVSVVVEEPEGGGVVASPQPQLEIPSNAQEEEAEGRATPKRSGTTDTIKTTPAEPTPQVNEEVEQEGEDSADSEDEFFDAIDSNNIPNLVVPASLTLTSPSSSSSSHSPTTSSTLPPYVSVEPYKAYEVLRTRLDTPDERPPTSLWSVLKHSIGKDLTKISFPVFFNEPTSMLQRMAEDMEFSECLDTAATQRDSLKRLAFVAAFAMSNYSSTIGRIAKPFNPMLSETFEYVRLDKRYRYVSEQVSHHPPISACWAESPLWHYFGEVDAQNKFMGKSFEIRPTGVAHAELVIPEEWGGPRYPKAPGVMGKGKVVEHYTWKKVTTNVSGFILGSPTIDHYGDMVIRNHRTGEQCVLTFKPRGWRGKDAYEISGRVMDSRGRVVYEIAGRWNSQLIMREVGKGHDGVLNPDTTVNGTNTNTNTGTLTPTTNTGPEYILLWKNSVKPHGSPFNLTPFAISLNDCPKETLRPFLCPTDCRLRPDQRAFEMGRYDLANELKGRQEEKQRGTRRAREAGLKEGHRPRWFCAETDGDTGERVWVPKRVRVKMSMNEGNGGEGEVVEEDRVEYWVERERVWREGGRPKAQWKDVEEIFIEEPEAIRG